PPPDLVVASNASRSTVRSAARTPQAEPAGDAGSADGGAAVGAAVGASAAAASASADNEPKPGERLAARAGQDIFGPRSWLPPPPKVVAPPPPPPPAPVVADAPPPPPPPPPPPALPYRFVGLLEDDAKKPPRVFLSIGDKLIVAATGDVLDGGFRLEAIKPTELVFKHVQQGSTARMPLAGAPS
ncbi:MAG: hypothetical protein AB9M60_17865, partial [Leptothrix sp. (in: b-proteobacteria)]